MSLSKLRVEVSGLPEVVRLFERFGEAAPRKAAEVLDKAADAVVRVALPMVPDDPETGDSRLASSLRRLKARLTKGAYATGPRAEVSVVVGGAKLRKWLKNRKGPNVWALVQHNDTTLRHTRGRAMFLYVALEQVGQRLPDEVGHVLEQEADRASA